MRLIMFGPPAAGKGTISAELEKKYRVKPVSTGDVLREAVKNETALGKEAKTYMDQGKLVPDNLMIRLIEDVLERKDCEKGFILDGFPRTEQQGQALESMLAEKNMALDMVIYLNASEPVLMERITGRRICKDCGAVYHLTNYPPKTNGVCDKCGGELYQRKDDNEETMKQRLAVYRSNTRPLLDYFRAKGILIEINGDNDKSLIIEELLTKIQALSEN